MKKIKSKDTITGEGEGERASKGLRRWRRSVKIRGAAGLEKTAKVKATLHQIKSLTAGIRKTLKCKALGST